MDCLGKNAKRCGGDDYCRDELVRRIKHNAELCRAAASGDEAQLAVCSQKERIALATVYPPPPNDPMLRKLRTLPGVSE